MDSAGEISRVERQQAPVAGVLLAHGLNAGGVEPRVEFPLVHAIAGREPHQGGSQQGSKQRQAKNGRGMQEEALEPFRKSHLFCSLRSLPRHSEEARRISSRFSKSLQIPVW